MINNLTYLGQSYLNGYTVLVSTIYEYRYMLNKEDN